MHHSLGPRPNSVYGGGNNLPGGPGGPYGSTYALGGSMDKSSLGGHNGGGHYPPRPIGVTLVEDPMRWAQMAEAAAMSQNVYAVRSRYFLLPRSLILYLLKKVLYSTEPDKLEWIVRMMWTKQWENHSKSNPCNGLIVCRRIDLFLRPTHASSLFLWRSFCPLV